MKRREFIAGLGSAAAWPIAARAQQGERVRRVGVLLPWGEDEPQARARLSAFVKAFAELGWSDGRYPIRAGDQPQNCESAWNKDPVFGVIGIQSGPRG
jgi:hypothetical protein